MSVAIVTFPFKPTAPVPVENVPPPFCAKVFPLAIVTSPFKLTAPPPVENVPVPAWLNGPPDIVVPLAVRMIPPLTELRIRLLLPPDSVVVA